MTRENIDGVEEADSGQKIWLYAEDSKTLVQSYTTNANGWVNFDLQPEHFAIAYLSGKQWIYQPIEQNPGSLKVVHPYVETLRSGTCPVSQTLHVSTNYAGRLTKTEAHTNHVEWDVTTKLITNVRGAQSFDVKICAARAPVGGFDLWIQTLTEDPTTQAVDPTPYYQTFRDVVWESESNLVFEPQALSTHSLTIIPGAQGISGYDVLVANSNSLTVFEDSFAQGAQNNSVVGDLLLPSGTGDNYTMVVFAQDGNVNSYKITRSLDSLEDQVVQMPDAPFEDLQVDKAQRHVSWAANSTDAFDFYELNVMTRKGPELVLLLNKNITDFTLPELPIELGISQADIGTYSVSSVDYDGIGNLSDWLTLTQSTTITPAQWKQKFHEAEGKVLRFTAYPSNQ
jgi:hypothetical protein